MKALAALLLPFQPAVAEEGKPALKPRIVVLTDIAPNDVEPDDMESMIRLLAHADLFEIEALVATTGWSNSGGSERPDLIRAAIDAYEKDLPNLRKRSAQDGHREDESVQEIGYWPSPDYLRSRVVLGSVKNGMRSIGEGNDSAGSARIIEAADEDDERPLWVQAWGGGNTLAQAIWRVKADREPSQLDRFLGRLRMYTITDQDVGWAEREDLAFSSHQWMRREFERRLFFVWDECAWKFQNGTGKSRWDEYARHIQGHGSLGALYPKYKWGVEGDTPSFLYVLPNGLSAPEHPDYGGWGGCFEWGTTPDGETRAWVSQEGTHAHAFSQRCLEHLYPAAFHNFAARMDWAATGTGNRNPVAVVDGKEGLERIEIETEAGSTHRFDASGSSDPEGDALDFKWWILESGERLSAPELEVDPDRAAFCSLTLPDDFAAGLVHVICEVTDDGEPALTAYRRVVLKVR